MQTAQCSGCHRDFNGTTRMPRRLECSCVMCEKCLRILLEFQKKLVCYTHNMVTLKPIEELESVNIGQQQSCPEKNEIVCIVHQDEQKLYCMQDRKMICIKCESTQHEGHKYVPHEKVIIDLRIEIKSSLQNLMIKLAKNETQQNTVQNLLNNSKITIQEFMVNIQISYYQKLQRVCQEVLRSKISQQENYSEEISELEAYSKELKQKLQDINIMQENSIDQCNQKNDEVSKILRFIKENLEEKYEKYLNLQLEKVEQIELEVQKKFIGEKYDNLVKEEQEKSFELTQQFKKEIQELKQQNDLKEVLFEKVLDEQKQEIQKVEQQQAQIINQSKILSEQIQILKLKIQQQNENKEKQKQENEALSLQIDNLTNDKNQLQQQIENLKEQQIKQVNIWGNRGKPLKKQEENQVYQIQQNQQSQQQSSQTCLFQDCLNIISEKQQNQVKIEQCGHSFCKECFAKYIQKKTKGLIYCLEDEKGFNTLCPAFGCTIQIKHQDVDKAFDQQVKVTYKDQMIKRAKSKNQLNQKGSNQKDNIVKCSSTMC